MAKNSTKRKPSRYTYMQDKKKSVNKSDDSVGVFILSLLNVVWAIGITYFLTCHSVNWVKMTFIFFMWMIVLVGVFVAIPDK